MTLLTDAQTLINDARTFANDSFEDASELVKDAQTAAQSFINLSVPELIFDISDIDTDVVDTDKPGIFEDSFVAPSASDIAAPTFESHYIPVIPEFPTAPSALDTSELFQQATPTFDISGFDEEVPNIDATVNLPTVPEITFPDAPESDAEALTAPSIATPTFDKEFTGIHPGQLGDLEGKFEARYDTLSPQMREAVDAFAESYLTRINPQYYTQLEALESKLTSAISEGNALSDEYESRVFDRARARVEAQQAGATKAISESLAKRGFEIPGGALVSGTAYAAGQVTRGVSEAASSTAIDRATRELQHVQFAMQLSSSMRQAMIGSALQYMSNLTQLNGQAIEYAKQVADYMVQAYNTAIAMYEQDRQVYEAEARVFEVRLESAFAELRSFTAQLEAIRSQTEVEQLEVRKYESLIAAEKTRIDLYLGQLEGVSKQNELKRLSLEIFAEKVKAYSARVAGKEAEYNAYRAALGGDEARVRAYSEEVRSYSASVDAARAKVAAEAEHSRSINDYNRALVSQFEAKIAKYRAELEAEGKRFDSSTDAYKASLDRYRTVLDAELKLVDTEFNRDRLLLDAERARHRGKVDVLLAQGNITSDRIQLIASTATNGATVLGNLASAALSAQNTMVTLSATES